MSEQEYEIEEVQHAAFKQGQVLGILCCCGKHDGGFNTQEEEFNFGATASQEEIVKHFKEKMKYMLFIRRTDDSVIASFPGSSDEESHAIVCVKLVASEE